MQVLKILKMIYSPFFSLHNAVRFIILTYLVSVLFTLYIQCVLKLKKKLRRQKFNRQETVKYNKRHVKLFQC